LASTTLSAAPRTDGLCRPVAGATELEEHFAVRHRIFVTIQGLFEGSDRDARDDAPDTIHVVGFDGGQVAGAVRLYPLDGAGRWQGDRLAVLPRARTHHVGVALVQRAVALAGERGGVLMVARVQRPNVRFFERLGWSVDGPPGPYRGVVHQRMTIPLGEALRRPPAA
jgi:putative N-acetyltransferase (TIGR04045 family)